MSGSEPMDPLVASPPLLNADAFRREIMSEKNLGPRARRVLEKIGVWENPEILLETDDYILRREYGIGVKVVAFIRKVGAPAKDEARKQCAALEIRKKTLAGQIKRLLEDSEVLSDELRAVERQKARLCAFIDGQ